MQNNKSVVVPLPADVWGGLHGVVCAIDQGLKSYGYQQRVLLPLGALGIRDQMNKLGVFAECVPLPRFKRSIAESIKAGLNYFSAVKELSEISFIANADIFENVGAHHFHSLLLSRKLKKPLVWQLHSSMLTGLPLVISKCFIDKFQDGVIANGEQVARHFLGSDYGLGNHGIFYPPIDGARFKPNSLARTRVRSELGLDEKSFLVGTIGNRSWQKNHQLFLDIAEEILTIDERYKFLIVGAPVEAYQKTYSKEVLQRMNQLNNRFSNNIHIIHAKDGVDEVIHAIDLLLLTSRAEGLPLVIGEAMSAGKACISTDVGSISEILESAPVSCVIDGFEPCSFADKILSVGGMSGDDAEQNSVELISEAHRIFDINSTAKAHAEIYDKALSALN